MSGKRPADTGSSSAPRQFKQTKLSFFTSASRNRPKTPPTVAPEEPQEIPISPSTTTGDEADLAEPQSAKEAPSAKTSNQDTKTDTDTDPKTTPPQASPTPPSTTTPTTTTPTPNPAPTPTTVTPPPARIRITDRIGDLFAAPPNTILIHACNAVGSWGGGIALAFRNLYPAEYRVYRAHCARSTPQQLVGTALLIPPQRPHGDGGGGTGQGRGRGHYIGCLFTSRSHGRAKDPPERIVAATAPAMRDLMRLIVEEEGRIGRAVGEVRMCRINSGLFAVPWGRSKRVIEEMELREEEVPACGQGGVVQVVAYERA